MISRRKILGAGTAMALASCAPTLPKTGDAPLGKLDKRGLENISLNDIALTKGLRFGNAMSSGASLKETAYTDVVKANCGTIVAENEFKMYTIQPVDTPYRWTRPDQIVKFAKDNGMDMRGHTLLWNKDTYMPRWVIENDFKDGAEAFLQNYIRAVAGRYNDEVYSWDVVNETIDEGTGKRRDTVFTRNGGQEIVGQAFHMTKDVAPDAQLVYNDFMSWENHSAAHRMGVLKLLEGFKKDGVPVDALGIQGHIGQYAGDAVNGFKGEYSVKEWTFFLKEVTDMGYDLLITEFDVNDTHLNPDIEKRDQVIADYAKEYLDVTLDFKQVKEVVAWGLSDNHSWLRSPDWWPRKDGLDKRNTPYSDEYEAKPLRHAIARALAAAPKRIPSV